MPSLVRAASGDYDVAIVGAGAAGLSAAQKIVAAGRRCILLEASSQPGGRIAVGKRASGAVFDKGANRLSAGQRDPLIAIAKKAGLHLYTPPAGKRLYVGEREARDNEYDDFTAALGRTSRTISAVAELGRDVAASRALPDLGEWQGTVSFTLGPLTCGKDLDEVSTVDLSKLEERYDDAMIREGTSMLLAAAAKPLEIETDAVVRSIDLSTRGRVGIETSKGTVSARSVIVTASTGVLAAGRIRFYPSLPSSVSDAFVKLSLGTRERAVFELPGNPYNFAADERVIFKTGDTRSLMFTMRPNGSNLVYADFGGRFGRELSEAGDKAIADFIMKQLADHFGNGKSADIGKLDVVRWSREPYVMGGIAAAAPGANGSRQTLTQPVGDRLFFAGEATHEVLWGTVAGAAISGERASGQALSYLGVSDAPTTTTAPALKKKR
jgi:monoamine oxidase